MKRIIIFLLISLAVCPAGAVKIGLLKDVLNPTAIGINQGRIYIMDAGAVKVFSLSSLKWIRSFGKQGEGPGEYQTSMQYPLTMRVNDRYLLVEAFNKLLFFNPDGTFLKELKKPPSVQLIQPAGEMLVARRLSQPEDGSRAVSTIIIFTQRGIKKGDLVQQDFLQQGYGLKKTFNLGCDFLQFAVADHKIFVEKSQVGPLIEVFNDAGQSLYTIKIPYKKIKIDRNEQTRLLQMFKNDPEINRLLRASNLQWEDLSKNFTFRYPPFYPAVQEMEINQNRIYIKTFQVKDEKEEYIVLNLEGKVLKQVFAPRTVTTGLMSKMLGLKLSTIHSDTIYYLKETREETWELHVEKMD